MLKSLGHFLYLTSFNLLMKSMFRSKVIVIFFLVIGFSVSAQEKYSYLNKCFSGDINLGKREIKDIGKISEYSRVNKESVSMYYFNLPEDKKTLAPKRVLDIVVDEYIDSYANFSEKIFNKSYEVNGITIVEVRLLIHWKKSDSYSQAIFLLDGVKVYKIHTFKDSNDIVFFDSLINKIKNRQCL